MHEVRKTYSFKPPGPHREVCLWHLEEACSLNHDLNELVYSYSLSTSTLSLAFGFEH